MAPQSIPPIGGTTTATISRPSRLFARAAVSTPWEACKGCIAPGSINNKWYFALFSLLFLALVLGLLYFFFVARNGGIKYSETDWEDYKTVVLRRDPATSSRGSRTVVSGATGMNPARLAALSVVATDKFGRKGNLAKKGWAGTHSFTYTDGITNYDGKTVAGDKREWISVADKAEMAERKAEMHGSRYAGRDNDLADYAREAPARVGGLNKPRDGHMTGSETGDSSVSSESKKSDRRHKRVVSEAERMERRWRREARANAARMAAESGHAPPQRERRERRERRGEGYTFSQPESYKDMYRPNRG